MVNPPRILYRGGRVYTPVDPTATALLVDGDHIAWLGPDADAPAADVIVELDGALVTPAFVDAHVHCTDTGITLGGLNLAGVASARGVLDAVAAHVAGRAATPAADRSTDRSKDQSTDRSKVQGAGSRAALPADAVVIGHGWDESGWADQTPPGAAELDRAAGGRAVYLSRACVHSALVSSALLSDEARAAAGYDASGWLRRDAHHVARAVALGSVGAGQRREAQRTALARAASLGIAAVHECGGPGTSSEHDFTGLLALAGEGGLPEVYGYWGELGAAAKAKELGAVGAGGDLYADGSLGAHTAHLRQSYLDGAAGDGGGDRGHGYLSVAQVTEHLVDCARLGVQGGFHAIGDAAIATVLDGFAGAEQVVGQDRLRAGRHRIEHVELLDKALIARLVGFGVVASVQPAFDRLWGGDAGMYAQRLGVVRSLAANPIGSLASVGVSLAFGSDSPVTGLDPWGTCRAAMRHHNPVQRLGARAAFAAHTRGGWRAVRRDNEGVLNPGWPATFAVWSTRADLPTTLAAEGPPPVAVRTVVRGETIHTSR